MLADKIIAEITGEVLAPAGEAPTKPAVNANSKPAAVEVKTYRTVNIDTRFIYSLVSDAE